MEWSRPQHLVSTGHHVWSDRYDRELKDVFALQDEITMKIMRAVGIRLVSGEEFAEDHLPPSGNLEVLMKAMKAYEYFNRMNKEDNILARKEVEEAIALDPEYSILYSLLACTHLMDLWFQSSEAPLISLAQMSRNIKKALALNDQDYFAYFTLANLYQARKERDKATAAFERAIAINPNGSEVYAQLGNHFAETGKTKEGIKLIEKAMRLNPIPPVRYFNYLANAYAALGRYEDAIEFRKKVLERSPNNQPAHIGLTADYIASGREEEARQQAEELLRSDPAFCLDKYAETVFLYAMDKAKAERYIADLRKAGLK